MLRGKPFAAFVEDRPISVMVRGTVERIFDPEVLERIFQDHAVLGYIKELSFSACVPIMSDVVFKESPSVGAYCQAHRKEIPVTRQAVYDKLKRLESQVPAALVCYSATELLPCLKLMGTQPPPLLPHYRLRVLDGNHLAGTEHRIFELRRFRAAALPGQAFFVIRQHASTLSWELPGKRRLLGKDRRGRDICEQAIRMTDPETGETLNARRITIVLEKPTSDGETELHILTNLPRKAADAVRIAELYADRWTIETAFQEVTDDLCCLCGIQRCVGSERRDSCGTRQEVCGRRFVDVLRQVCRHTGRLGASPRPAQVHQAQACSEDETTQED